MKNIKIYLCGAMTNRTFEQMNSWREKATDKIDKLNLFNSKPNRYFTVINPVENFPIPDKEDLNYEREAMVFDLYHVRTSNLILVKLENSIGTAVELYEAQKLNIPVIGYIENNEVVHPWMKMFCNKITNSLEECIDYAYKYYIRNM